MKRRKYARVSYMFILAAFLSVYISVHAAGAPTIFSYQGRLTNSSGDLLGGSGTTYYFKFSIWDNATVDSGSRLWPTSAPGGTSATVRSGVFNINVGDTANGYPDALNLDFNTNANIYLQVEVSSDNSTFETVSPRQRISSAVFAQLAGAVSGTAQSSIGTVSPYSSGASAAVLTVEATTTSAIPLVIRGILNQSADLFRVVSSAGTQLLSFDSAGKVEVNNENIWACSGGGCGANEPATKGNVVVETGVVFDNNFTLKQIDASTTIMYDTTDTAIFQFDEAQ